MDEIIDFLHDIFPDGWFDDAVKHYGLSDEEVAQSVHEASAFFNMDDPMIIKEYGSTGVRTGLPFTENDDILYFSRQQLQDMGITDKQGFDLVMTHEGTHRMLQSFSDTLSPHQEELCCDYMSGVRAGLNDMDIISIEQALAEQPEGSVHPVGTMRIEAISQGRQFAEQYYADNGHAPTFEDCYERFCETFPENHFVAEDHDMDDIKEYTQSEIDRHIAKAERDMHEAQSRMEYYANWMSKHGKSVMVSADRDYLLAKRDYEHAKDELNKWKYKHPDPKGFVETEMDTDNIDTIHSYTESNAYKAHKRVEDLQTEVNNLDVEVKKSKRLYGIESNEYKRAKNKFDSKNGELMRAQNYSRSINDAVFHQHQF